MSTAVSLRRNSDDLWSDAVAQLNEELRNIIDFDRLGKREIVSELLKQANISIQHCEDRAWTFARGKSGETVIVRDVLGKVVKWIDHFKQIGDIAVQYDPGHAALPWAGVRFLLEIATKDVKTFASVVEHIPLIAELICRSALIEELLLRSSLSPTADELRQALVLLYVRVMDYLARARAYVLQRSAKRVLKSFSLATSDLDESFNAIGGAQENVDRCFNLASVQANLERHEELKSILANFQAPLNRWSEQLTKITDDLDGKKRTDVLHWLSAEPYLQHHEQAKEGMLEGTGQWLLSDPVFLRWKGESASSILWLHGIPGSGKSKLVSAVVEDALRAYLDNRGPQSPPPAYFYCSRNPAEPGRSDPKEILASIARQLSCVGPGLPLLPPTVAEHRKREREAFANKSLRLQESRDLILQLAKHYPVVIIVIDALDECNPATRRQFLIAMESIVRDCSSLVKIFVSSRDDQDIVYKLQDYPNLELSSDKNRDDIAKFVESETNSMIESGTMLRYSTSKEELRQKIIKEVTSGAHGMFRWAALQLQALCDLSSDAAIRERVGRLPPTLEDLYRESLEKLNNYHAEADRKYARRILGWLLCARRKLSLDEFLTAVSIAVPSGGLLPKEQVLRLCHNLVIFDQALDTFRFAHLSVREFLEKQAAYAPSLINAWAAEACLLTLIRRVDNKPSTHLPSEWQYHLDRTNRMASYANTYWAPHCQAAASQRSRIQLKTLLSGFMSSTISPRSPFFLWTMQLNDLSWVIDFEVWERLQDCRSTLQPSPIFTACAFDISEVFEQVKDGFVDASLRNATGKSCQHIAAQYGSCGVLRILVAIQSIKITGEVVKAAAGNWRNGKEVMALLLEKRGDEVKITEEVVKAAAGNRRNGKEVMTLLLEERGDEVGITEEVVKVAAGNGGNGREVMALLLEKRGGDVKITEEVVKAAARNVWNGRDVMALLLEERGDEIEITEKVVKAAARNEGNGKDVMALLLEKRGGDVKITEEVVKAAARNRREAIALLLEKRGDEVEITEEVVKAAARNLWNGKEVMALLLEKRGGDVEITKEVVKAAAENRGNGKEVMALLLEERGDEVEITEEVVKAAARNRRNGKEVIALLLEKRGDDIKITEEVFKTIAGNRREAIALLLEKRGDDVEITEELVKAAANVWNGKEGMALLLEKRGDDVEITEEVVKAVARNEGNGKDVMALLLKKRGGDVKITKEVVKTAADNRGNGKEVMALLLEERGDEVEITEEVVKAAARNEGDGKDVIALLLEKRGGDVKITEEVVKTVARNRRNGKEMMAILLEKRGGDVKITEEVVKAAARNEWNGKEVMALILEKRGDDVEITEEVVMAAAGNEYCGDKIMAFLLRQRLSSVRASITAEVYLTASACGQLAVLDLLSRHFSHCPIKEELVTTAKFYLAAKNGDIRLIKNFLDKNIYPDTANIRGETPLWISAARGHTAVVDILLKTQKVNVNTRSVSGRSPIFWPSARGFDRIVAMLIDAGARADFVDEEGQTAISMARKHGHWGIAHLLGRLESDEEVYRSADNKESMSATGRENQSTKGFVDKSTTTTRSCRRVYWALGTLSALVLFLLVGFQGVLKTCESSRSSPEEV
ncbi:ankyrin [Parathielavia appendiculata]|uniref:Ankyrin n=1 Tax=Parathielavia appendiculata TaxID=2587402 RepID=A0AAN6TPZ9_9PEZI|nr:ankyrin [Parathielavia appendiculata]